MTFGLWRTLQADVYRYRSSTEWRSFIDAWIREPGFRYTWYMRKVTFYAKHKRGLGFFGFLYNRILLNHYRFRYGYDISPAVAIGPGFYIGHFGGIVINPAVIIGSNVNIMKGVTIGATNRGARKGCPTIQDRVWIGANATVVGKILIEEDALIAPGAYVNFDVPKKAVVMGNPGQIISAAGSEGYVNNILQED